MCVGVLPACILVHRVWTCAVPMKARRHWISWICSYSYNVYAETQFQSSVRTGGTLSRALYFPIYSCMSLCQYEKGVTALMGSLEN